jgi:hypothetical protein
MNEFQYSIELKHCHTERFTDLELNFPLVAKVLGSILPQLPLKTMLNSKVVKIDPKITMSLCYSKSVTHCIILQKRVYVGAKWNHTFCLTFFNYASLHTKRFTLKKIFV